MPSHHRRHHVESSTPADHAARGPDRPRGRHHSWERPARAGRQSRPVAGQPQRLCNRRRPQGPSPLRSNANAADTIAPHADDPRALTRRQACRAATQARAPRHGRALGELDRHVRSSGQHARREPTAGCDDRRHSRNRGPFLGFESIKIPALAKLGALHLNRYSLLDG